MTQVPPAIDPPPRLLCVDDDPLCREALASLLTQEGFDATCAASGEEGVAHLRAARPAFALVLTDLVMPGLSGLDVLREARRCDADCAVLVVTGFAQTREAREALEQGAFELIAKPLSPEALRGSLRRLRERCRLLEARRTLQARVVELEGRCAALQGALHRLERLSPRLVPQASLGDLERLGALRAQGLLTESEFLEAKRDLLPRLWAGSALPGFPANG